MNKRWPEHKTWEADHLRNFRIDFLVVSALAFFVWSTTIERWWIALACACVCLLGAFAIGAAYPKD